jgi:Zn finger protein HypA/HybF involved in hydrogenase expression
VIVRCGRCQTQFDAPGEGRFACPACGTANEVKSQPGAPGMVTPPPPPEPEVPSPRVACGECGFSFIVGDVEAAPCPMCGLVVQIGSGEGDES